jgi:tryptophanase
MIIEPFRIKSIEPIRWTTRDERLRALQDAYYNLFLLEARDVLIDLLTDAGTGAMSTRQWAAVVEGDESYAGSASYKRFKTSVQEIFGYPHVIPTQRARDAERILFSVLCKPGDVVPNNTHFDTTRANVEAVGAEAVDLLMPYARDHQVRLPFKGNMNVEALVALLARVGTERIPLVMLTMTNTSCGGQPVSLENVRQVSGICRRHGIPLYFDACRFAENAWFIKEREAGYTAKTPREIAREIFALGDGCTMSAQKDGMANVGGFLCTNDDMLNREDGKRNLPAVVHPIYGGLAGRDLEAIALGLDEALDEDYLRYRIASTSYLGNRIAQQGVPIVEPPGGHAVYIDANAFLPQVPPVQFPGAALAAEIYLEGGIRTAEIGSLTLGASAPVELVRLAIPRRVYTQSHIDYVIDVVMSVWQRRASLRGMRLTSAAHSQRHFTAHLEPLADGEPHRA